MRSSSSAMRPTLALAEMTRSSRVCNRFSAALREATASAMAAVRVSCGTAEGAEVAGPVLAGTSIEALPTSVDEGTTAAAVAVWSAAEAASPGDRVRWRRLLRCTASCMLSAATASLTAGADVLALRRPLPAGERPTSGAAAAASDVGKPAAPMAARMLSRVSSSGACATICTGCGARPRPVRCVVAGAAAGSRVDAPAEPTGSAVCLPYAPAASPPSATKSAVYLDWRSSSSGRSGETARSCGGAEAAVEPAWPATGLVALTLRAAMVAFSDWLSAEDAAARSASAKAAWAVADMDGTAATAATAAGGAAVASAGATTSVPVLRSPVVECSRPAVSSSRPPRREWSRA